MKLIIFFILVFSTIQAEAQFIGLKPTFRSLGMAEALTASADSSEALYYNPAGLSWYDVSIRLVGVENRGDTEGLNRINEVSEVSTEDTIGSNLLETLYEKLDSEKPLYAASTVRAVDVVLPFVAVSSFLDAQLRNTNIENDTGVVDREMFFQTDVGAIVGAGFRFKSLGFGVSYYRLGRARVVSTPTTEQRDQAITAIQNGTFSESTVPFRDFTSFYYGGTEGKNIGFQFRPLPENRSGFGVSVLNVGGAKFKPELGFNDSELKKLEENFKEEVAAYGIDLQTPEEIPETINAGITLSAFSTENPFMLNLNLEGNDLDGSSVDEKFAGSVELGLDLPGEIAMLTAFPIYYNKDSDFMVHLGLAGLKVFGGVRPDAYSSYGATVALHIGVQRIFSPIKAEITVINIEPAEENSRYLEQAGTLTTAGLTWIMR